MKNDVFLDCIVVNAIDKGCSSLLDIATCCGIYPTELKNILDGLIRQKKVFCDKNDQYHIVGEALIPAEFHIPPPHPFDYDWRFDGNTTSTLTEELLNECGSKNTILLLGTHSIQIELYRRKVTNKVVLLDSNTSLIEELRCHDDLPNYICLHKDFFVSGESSLQYEYGNVGVVFMDPPWYMDFYMSFLTFAARTVKIGGAVFVSLMPIGTRPTAYKEREKLFARAKKCGLHLEQLHKNYITYVTPEFEKKSLAIHGIINAGNWRKGDMAVFRKVHQCKDYPEIDVSSKSVHDDVWLSFNINGYPVKIRNKYMDTSSPDIITIEDSDILPTVSRRYKGRDKIDLWLWDNRVFGIAGNRHFIVALYRLSQTEMPETFKDAEESHVNTAILLLKDILKDIL
jgi:hypothetical protein